jgi:glycerophosphoryl diester phosphodiesterase
VIDLFRKDGRPLVVGHRGAAALAPENTIAAFRAAVDLGVDLVELDVLALQGGPLVVAHSDRLEEVTHGALSGRVDSRSLAELREVAPALATFEEALAWFSSDAPQVGIHVDLKLRHRLDEVAELLERHGVADRAVVSSVHADALHAVARYSSRVGRALTYPEDRLRASRHRPLQPVVKAALASLRLALPLRLPRMVRAAGAGALMLQHRVITSRAVARAHALGVPVFAWTVDEQSDAERVIIAGVDGVITNDPRVVLATLAA